MKNIILKILFIICSLSASAQTLPNIWVPTSGTDTYSTNILNFGSSYANKIAFVKFGNTNTGASTININSLGAANIRMWDGDSWELLTAGQIDVNTVYKIAYQGSYFELESFAINDRAYSDGHLASKIISAPSLGQNGQAIRWNNSTPAWEYFTPQMLSLGAATRIPFMNSTGNNLAYSNKLKYDSTNNVFIAGSNITYTGGGVKNNNFIFGIDHIINSGTTNIRWLTLLGEAATVTTASTGVNHNSIIFGGFNNSIINTATGSTFNAAILNGANHIIRNSSTGSVTSSTILGGREGLIENASAAIGAGYNFKITGRGGITFGYSTTYNGAGSLPGSVQPVWTDGVHGINLSANSPASIVNEGCFADYGAIVGGLDHHIPATSPRSGIYGGNAIKARANDPDQIYVPNLNIVTIPTRNDTISNVLVGDYSVTGGPVKRVYAGAMVSSLPVKTITTTYTALLDDNLILADASGGSFTINLPPAAAAYDGKRGHEYIIKVISITGMVTIDGNGSEQVEFATNQPLTGQGARMRIQTNGTAWYSTGE